MKASVKSLSKIMGNIDILQVLSFLPVAPDLCGDFSVAHEDAPIRSQPPLCSRGQALRQDEQDCFHVSSSTRTCNTSVSCIERDLPLTASKSNKLWHDFAKWNAGWEALFPLLNSTVGNLGSLVASHATLPSSEFQEELRMIHNIVRGICRTQEDLCMLAVTSVLEPNFCWKTLSPAAREAHMLEGLMRVCLNEPDSAPKARLYTCDITLVSLESCNGEGFLALLRRYVPVGASHLVPASGMVRGDDRGFPKGQERRRTDFLYNTILSIIGTPRPPEFAFKAHGIQSSSLDWGSWSKRPTNKKPNSEAPKETPVYRLGKICDGCSRSERDDDPRFMMSHWQNHKQICGKELTPATIQLLLIHTEASLADAVFLLERMGPARVGYARSSALVRQILYLDATPSTRLCVLLSRRSSANHDSLIPPPPSPPPHRADGKRHRRPSIAALSEVVVQCPGYASTAFLDQFVAEYGDAAASATKPTDASGLFRPAGKLINRWKDQFLRSEAGSKYARIANEPPEGPSVEVKRKVGLRRRLGRPWLGQLGTNLGMSTQSL
ncbi:hypothetical protein C8J57DRAFT_1232523 [Mycena rebaudengoi]|nr:hypothetical protein C8J57DRAFT_1232523 [Mycena rebaudengoi]